MSEYEGKKEFSEAATILESIEKQLADKLAYRARLDKQIEKLKAKHWNAVQTYVLLKHK